VVHRRDIKGVGADHKETSLKNLPQFFLDGDGAVLVR